MAKKWTLKEEKQKRNELVTLYKKKNKSIGEIAKVLNLGQSTVYDRLLRLGITPVPFKKIKYNNIRRDITIPKVYSPELAELIGILLGDGHITPTQITVTLGKKDEYADYVADLIYKIFKAKPKNTVLKSGHRLIYIGSTAIVRWLMSMGLAQNKIKNQVDVPRWIFQKKNFRRRALRGLFDTDGSVYKLKFGNQISFTNYSKPLIRSVREMLIGLKFHPSKIKSKKLYLTRKDDLRRFYKEIGFKNQKHGKRFLSFLNNKNLGASHSGNCSGL